MIEELRGLVSEEARVIAGDEIKEKYRTDTLGRLKGRADALVQAVSTEEVSAVMRYAYRHGIPVTPRGAGTNLVGSTVPQKAGIILDVSRMNRILEIDEETFTATVEPGVLLKDFQARVESLGLFYPPDPGEKAVTLGGNIATNAGGMRAVKYGVTRDYVRGLEVVLPDGQVVMLGGKNVKDASGLQLKHLFIGSDTDLTMLNGQGDPARSIDALRDRAGGDLTVSVDEEGGQVQRLAGIIGELPSAREMAATMTVGLCLFPTSF